jgi:SAM-dependent methyltransferase
VLDIGCGTGETCALWIAGGAEVTGVDISAPMLAVAAQRLQGKVTLALADASVWKSDAPFDVAVSRFGVMFFAAPEQAFANIAANLRPSGRLVFACWRALAENAWAATPLGAIRELLPAQPPPVPNAPGTFALADKERVRGILERAGFDAITIRPFDFPVSLTHDGGIEAAVRFAMQLGPAGAALAEVGPEGRALAAQRLAAALAPYERNGSVALAGAIWIVEATGGFAPPSTTR